MQSNAQTEIKLMHMIQKYIIYSITVDIIYIYIYHIYILYYIIIIVYILYTVVMYDTSTYKYTVDGGAPAPLSIDPT